LATLSDTDTTNAVGTELITNGTFASNTTGWTTGGGSSLSHQSGQAKVTATNTNILLTQQLSGLVVGQKYVLSATLTPQIGVTGNYWGAYLSNGYSGNFGEFNLTDQVATNISATFTATATNNYISIGGSTGAISSGEYLLVDNVSVRLAEPDRSVNGNGLQVFGTVTKAAVATGAELVKYSGFSSSNYLKYPSSTDLSFGSGDFCLIMWMEPTSTTSGYSFEQGYGIRIAYTANRVRFHVYGNGLTPQFTDSVTLPPVNSWHQMVFLRRNGLLEMYCDGEDCAGTVHSSATQTFSNATTTVIGTSGSTNYQGALALVRLGGTPPTQEQIKKMYNDEKHLFKENAKATLYGTSDAVTALAFDDDTELLHVGTSAGRSDFQGLRRVNNTTRAIGTAISAVDGFIVEE
jgi:hypothetical protein